MELDLYDGKIKKESELNGKKKMKMIRYKSGMVRNATNDARVEPLVVLGRQSPYPKNLGFLHK